MRCKFVLLFLLFIGSGEINIFAEDTIPEYDTNYIKSYHNYFVITLVAIWNSNNINITDNNNDDVVFTTNMPWYFGFAVDYKWFTLELTKNLNTYPDNNKGQTESKSIGFGITGRKFWFRNFWKIYKGYYMQNPEYFNPNFNEEIDPFPVRTDLKTKIYFANLNYGFNYKRYSNIASLWQLEKQKKSAGSFTAGLSFAFTEYSADSTLIEPEWRENFEDDALINHYNLTVLGINGGYLHTFSMFHKRKIFISFALIPGLSYQTGKATLDGQQDSKRKQMLGFQNEFRVVLGYNHNRWYSSFSANFHSISNKFSETNTLFQNYSFIRFMLGYKIKTHETKSKFLKKLKL